MKKLLITLSLLLFTATAFAADSLPTPTSSLQPINQVAAVVNDSVITQQQVDKTYKNAIKQMRKQGVQIPDESTMKTEILNQLINQKLQLQLAKSNGIRVTKLQVTQAIKNIAKQHKISVAALLKKVKAEGMSLADYRKEIKKQITVSIIQHKALGKKVQVTDAEVNQFLEKYKSQEKFATQYHLIDVLVPLPSAPTTTQEKQAKVEALQLLKSLRHGADINSLKGAEVNDLGFRSAMRLPTLFAKQLPKMKPGSIVGPLRAENGYHILKLVKIKKGEAQLPSRTQVKNMLTQQKLQKVLRIWVKKLREQSYIKILNPQ